MAFEKVAEEEAGRLSIAQRIILQSTDHLSFRQQEGKEVSRCHICAQIATAFTWKTTCGGSGSSASKAMVFKAQAVPQSLCENLINTLKLLANQQKDGDSPVQSIVAKLCERSRKGILEGLTNFTEFDNRSALKVSESFEGRYQVV